MMNDLILFPAKSTFLVIAGFQHFSFHVVRSSQAVVNAFVSSFKFA